MPRLSDSMEEGTVSKWLVEEGAQVLRGQPLVEIDTDKATMEYEAEDEGVLLQILVREGETAAIGAPIARVGSPSETPEAPAPSAPARPASAPARANASPVAKRIAKELGVELACLEGTGPNGMITREDVERAAGEAGGAPGPRTEPLSRVQQAVARHMLEAAGVPTFAAEVEVDMTACAALRDTLESRPSFNDL